MGSLIQTKGTQRLMKWYNTKCFDKGSLPNTRSAIAGDGTLLILFATPAGQTPVIQQICNNPTGKSIFLPPYHPAHKNLLTRWDYYLGHGLQYGNQDLLRAYLWNAINNGINQYGDPYTAIVVDCVEGTTQTVLQSDEYELKPNDPDGKAMDPSKAYSHITLVTQVMSTQLPVPLDPQFQASLKKKRSDSKGKGKVKGKKGNAKKAKKAKKAKA
jgi:hypothetical protein